jgi:hypothetical protein
MFLKTAATFLLISSLQSLSAQKILIDGTEGNRSLQWPDFKAAPNNSSPYFAYTAWKTNVKFGGVQFEGEKAIINGFEMTVEFDAKNSWVKKGKETEELLRHEQGHFDIGLLYMQEVLQSIATASFTKSGYKDEFEKLIKDIHHKYVVMGDKYDKDTNHSIQKDEQAKWNAFFEEKVSSKE